MRVGPEGIPSLLTLSKSFFERMAGVPAERVVCMGELVVLFPLVIPNMYLSFYVDDYPIDPVRQNPCISLFYRNRYIPMISSTRLDRFLRLLVCRIRQICVCNRVSQNTVDFGKSWFAGFGRI